MICPLQFPKPAEKKLFKKFPVYTAAIDIHHAHGTAVGIITHGFCRNLTNLQLIPLH